MQRITTGVMWIMHWAFQGLKLLFFAMVALVAAFLAIVTFALIDSGLRKFLDPGRFTSAASLVTTGLGLIVALAVWTATLASMLTDHPLLPFKQKPRGGVKPNEADPGITLDA